MSGSGSKKETEIKLRLLDATHGRRLLRQHGFKVLRRRAFEANVLFDTPLSDLRKQGALLRLRNIRRLTILTYKGPASAGKHKSRDEIEVEISDSDRFSGVLRHLGFSPVFRYEKYRTEYQGDSRSGIVTLDETPLGCFLELEGSPAWIDRTARQLSFSERDYITASYGRLYLDFRSRDPSAPHDMIFPPTLGGKRHGKNRRSTSEGIASPLEQ